MRKRGEGTYYREDSRHCWAVRIGQRRIVRKADTASALKEKVHKVQRDLSLGTTAREKPPTLERFLEGYLEEAQIAKATLRSYMQSAAVIVGQLGTVKLEKLTPSEVEVAGKSITAKHGSGTARNAHAFLRSALRIAERDGILTRNVAAIARAPKHKPHPKRFLSATEATKFLDALPATRYGHFLRFVLFTGLRIGEATAVSPFDVTEAGVRVRKSKTPAGEWRLVPLQAEARRAVREMTELRARDAETMPWEDRGVLFSSVVGTQLEKRNISRALSELLQQEGLPHVSVHDLRRTFATHLAVTGVDETSLASIMGHANTRITREYYVMAQEELKAAAVDLLTFKPAQARQG